MFVPAMSIALDCVDQLRLIGSSFPETTLLVIGDLFLVQKFHDVAVDDVFHDLG